jgi:hypothetical protein
MIKKGCGVVKVRGVVGRKDQTTARVSCYRPRQKTTIKTKKQQRIKINAKANFTRFY